MGLRKKLVLIGVTQLTILATVMFGFYYMDAKRNITQQYVEKARSVVLTTESAREEVAAQWRQGIFDAEQLSAWAAEGKLDKVLAAVPVVVAMRAAASKAEEAGYQFKVPKFSPRNPKNQPDELEARVLKLLASENLSEYHELDPTINAIRYFRPIYLTDECLLCHGQPSRSAELWGNDDGLDPTGVRMEGWKAGEMHGAFEIIQPLDEADAATTAAMWKGGGVVALLIFVSSLALCAIITRTVVQPVRRLVNGLNDGADQVNDAAGQVSGSSQSLAHGASEQASSLEETSSALEEMAAMTRTNAANAEEASQRAGQARDAASGGDTTIRALNQAMSAIDESSGQIGKIIKVIEEIAFQTNLLALNAAVEAARAGEHGKGFAVVADEVRNLAQRSAQAAKETTVLIEDSVGKVQEGTRVAADVGEALGTIVTDVQQVSDLIDGISKASQEQAQGVDQVNTAVSQMDKVTQQNAAGAEQSAAAAEQLSAQAEQVKSNVRALMILVTGRTGS